MRRIHILVAAICCILIGSLVLAYNLYKEIEDGHATEGIMAAMILYNVKTIRVNNELVEEGCENEKLDA